MIYDYIVKTYKEGEPIFFSDLLIEGVSKPAVNQQLKTLCNNGKLVKYDTGVYYIPKTSLLHTPVGLSADIVARYRFISKGSNIDGFYTGNTFANQLGISTQVPRIVEIVSNNTNSAPREIEIGKRKFYVRKPIATITADNVYVLQMLDLLKSLDHYLDYSYEIAKEKFAKYIRMHEIKRMDVDKYIRKYPAIIFKNYYELELDHVLA
ncbi:MAG: DUF6088 family protein [Clostridium sp.]|nr:DUF6088 family protein [Clostridium sp.]